MARRTTHPAAALLLVVPVPLADGAGSVPAEVAATPAVRADEGDEQYRFLAGLIEKGLFDLAVDEARRFLEQHAGHPRAPLARYRLATALFELGRRPEAAEHYAPLLAHEGFEYRAESAFRLGQCLLDQERYDEATDALVLVLRLDQAYLHGPARFFLGEAELRRDDPDEAERRYREVLEDESADAYAADARRGLVWCAWERGEAAEAARRAADWLERHPSEPGAGEVRLLHGEALLAAGEMDAALAAYESVADETLGDARLRGIGFARAAAGDHAAAADAFAALLEEHPRSRFASEARLQAGVQSHLAGDPAAAVRRLAWAREAGDAEGLYWLAQAQEAAGEHEAALASLERAARAAPEGALGARVQVARGDVLHALGRTSEALAAYESGGSDYALHAAAVASLNAGDPASAARLATTLLEEHPGSAYARRTRLVLAEARFAEEDWDAAEAAFRSAAQGPAESPDDEVLVARAVGRVGWCRYLAGDLAGAARGFRELVERFPGAETTEECLHMLGRVLVEAGRPEEARQVFALYLDRFPDGPHVEEVLLTSATALDDAEGLRLLGVLLEEHPSSPLAPRALVELGERLSEAERIEEAAAAYRRVVEEHRRDELVHRARYGLAWCLHRLGDHAEAARLLAAVGGTEAADEALREASWELCVWAAAEAGDPTAAEKAWRRFAESTSDDRRRLEAARTVAAAWRDAGRPQDAGDAIESLLGLVEDEGVAVLALVESAYLALEAEDPERAEGEVRVALERAPADPGALEAAFFVGEARFADGELARAATLYRAAAAEGSPVRASARYKLGFALLRSGDAAGAAEAFGAVVREHAGDEVWGESLFLEGEALWRLGRFEEAARAFDRLVREAPRHEVRPKALFRLGQSLGELGRWTESEAALTTLAREAPDFENRVEAELWRGDALAAQRKGRAARQAYERVVAEDKGELAARARIGLGRLLETEQRTEEALAEFLKVALLYAHEEEVAEALYRAGTCLETLGDTEKALEQYREVLASHPEARYAAEARKGVERLSGQ